jgi:hypothetical protein
MFLYIDYKYGKIFYPKATAYTIIRLCISLPFNEIDPVTPNDPVIKALPVIECVSVTALPIVTPVPRTTNSVTLPLVTVNCVGETDAVILPVAICDKFNPITPDAGTVDANDALKAFVANEAVVENNELTAFKT